MKFSVDAEKASPSDSPVMDDSEVDLLDTLNHYDVVDSIWHWSSVDLGKKCWYRRP